MQLLCHRTCFDSFDVFILYTESDTEHEIKSGKTQARTLLAKIAVLEMDMLKKEEKLYNADFQIQLMEGKVGRASGERRPDEEQATTKQIKDLETQLAQVQQEEVAIIAQVGKNPIYHDCSLWY